MKFRSTFYGVGKMGDIVGRKGKGGEYIISQYQPTPRNPQTQAQMVQRSKVALVGSFAKHLSGWAKIMCRGDYKLTGYGKLMKLLLPECITGTYPNFEIDFTHALISKGSVDLPYSPSASPEGTTLSLTWADNSGLGNALTTDEVCVCCYNATKNQCVYQIGIAQRNERNTTLTLPSTWTGDTVNVWMAMNRSVGTAEMGAGTSDSIHLATLAL